MECFADPQALPMIFVGSTTNQSVYQYHLNRMLIIYLFNGHMSHMSWAKEKYRKMPHGILPPIFRMRLEKWWVPPVRVLDPWIWVSYAGTPR